jgi:hypothetical protein
MVDVGRRTLRRRCTALLTALTVLLPAAAVRAERVVLDPTQRPRIVNGIDTHGFPSAGALLYSYGGPITSDNAASRCSGTLIGCETFLVAAHCVVDDPIAAHYLVYLQHAGLLPVASITRHPSYDDDEFPLFDVAVLKLGTWVTGIAPSPINQTDPAPFIDGATGIIVGFGQTAGLANDYGIKRAGTVETVNCPSTLPAGADDDDVLCWNFLEPIDPPGTDSNTCNGDSGGPMFIDFGGGLVVAGVTSGGTSGNCLPEDNSYDANVFTHRSFILGELGADSTTACGGLAPVGDAQTAVAEHDGMLSAVNPIDTYSVPVPAGANALRVALNSEDSGLHDVDLFVKYGPGASASNFDCAATGASVFGACTVDLPAAGTWSVAVQRGTFGSGEYQLTATVFGGPPPPCGNDVREFNEACDGSDDAQCPGQCQADCQCPAVCSEDDLTEIKARITPLKFKVRGRLQNAAGGFSGDPRQGFTLTLSQGANTVTVDIPAGDPGWATSKPERGRYKWMGALNGITRVKAIDRTAKKGIWKIVVVGGTVPGASGMNLELPLDITLTIDGACTATTF